MRKRCEQLTAQIRQVNFGGVIALLCLALFGGARAEAPAAAFGHIAYPALGNISLEEGTIEAWITLHFDPYEQTDSSYYPRAVLFDLHYGARQAMNTSWVIKQAPREKRGVHSQLWSSPFGAQGATTWLATPGTMQWEREQTLHVAVTWVRRPAPCGRLFIDGREVSKVLQENPWEQDPLAAFQMTDGTTLYLGSLWNNIGWIVVDEFRVSSVARRPEELGASRQTPLAPDRHTLLLDHFENVITNAAGRRETVADAMARHDGRTGGLLGGACRLVRGRTGNGVALFTVADDGGTAPAPKD